MIKKQRLDQIKQILDIIANLDDSYGIDKASLIQLYEILENIENEDSFNDTYKAILGNLNVIIDNLERFEKNISKQIPNRKVIYEEIKKSPIKVDLSAMGK